jgi:hypothetical protein
MGGSFQVEVGETTGVEGSDNGEFVVAARVSLDLSPRACHTTDIPVGLPRGGYVYAY